MYAGWCKHQGLNKRTDSGDDIKSNLAERIRFFGAGQTRKPGKFAFFWFPGEQTRHKTRLLQ